MTRWSNDNDIGRIKRGANSLPFHTGSIDDLDTPRIATSGAFTIGAKCVVPIPPRLEMVKQPPCISDAVNLPSRAFFDTSINSRESSIMPFLFTFLNTGTTKPFGVSTATPMLIYFFRIKR